MGTFYLTALQFFSKLKKAAWGDESQQAADKRSAAAAGYKRQEGPDRWVSVAAALIMIRLSSPRRCFFLLLGSGPCTVA